MRALGSKRFIVLGGKGGVGRTTTAAALALALARQGRRVLLAQTNAKERLSQLLDCPPVGPEITRVRERLWAVNMTPAASLREYGLMVLRYETVYKAVLENRMVRYFLRAIPGLDEYSMLGKAWYHTTEEFEAGDPKYHVVILDGPATGHLVAMLRIPQAILSAVPDSPLVRDARLTYELLTDAARTAVVLVTLAEDLPTNEVTELYQVMRRELHMAPAELVVNQVWPERFTRDGAPARVLTLLEQAGGTDDALLAPLVARAQTARRRRLLNERYLARLAGDIPIPQARLPLLFANAFGATEVEMLSRLLEEASR
jgi:anion-transporting  ArsA/GET3 family ATPase